MIEEIQYLKEGYPEGFLGQLHMILGTEVGLGKIVCSQLNKGYVIRSEILVGGSLLGRYGLYYTPENILTYVHYWGMHPLADSKPGVHLYYGYNKEKKVMLRKDSLVKIIFPGFRT
jgi:hypothetical protein